MLGQAPQEDIFTVALCSPMRPALRCALIRVMWLMMPKKPTCCNFSISLKELPVSRQVTRATKREFPTPIPPELVRLLPAASLAWQCVRLGSRSAAAAAERRTRHADIKCGSRPAREETKQANQTTKLDQKNCAHPSHFDIYRSLLRPYLSYVFCLFL